MNQTLKEAIREVETLPNADQEEIARELMKMALRRKIDAELAASEEEGGETPNDVVFRELRQSRGG